MSECTYYPSVIKEEDLQNIYWPVTRNPSWAFDLTTYAGDTEGEAPNPSINLLERTPPNLTEVCEFLKNATNSVLLDFCGKKYVNIEHNSFQITYEGHHGEVHSDGEGPNHVTTMFFLSPVWHPTWGGEFKIQTSNGEWGSVPYTPGSCVCFYGRLPHTGTGARVGAKKARLTYVTHGLTA